MNASKHYRTPYAVTYMFLDLPQRRYFTKLEYFQCYYRKDGHVVRLSVCRHSGEGFSKRNAFKGWRAVETAHITPTEHPRLLRGVTIHGRHKLQESSLIHIACGFSTPFQVD